MGNRRIFDFGDFGKSQDYIRISEIKRRIREIQEIYNSDYYSELNKMGPTKEAFDILFRDSRIKGILSSLVPIHKDEEEAEKIMEKIYLFLTIKNLETSTRIFGFFKYLMSFGNRDNLLYKNKEVKWIPV